MNKLLLQSIYTATLRSLIVQTRMNISICHESGNMGHKAEFEAMLVDMLAELHSRGFTEITTIGNLPILSAAEERFMDQVWISRASSIER